MKAYYHLPGLFEQYDLYSAFLPIFYNHRNYFYEWCEIGSLYGAPRDCIWGGGRISNGDVDIAAVLRLINQYHISARLTFSNSLLTEEHLLDKKCNHVCSAFHTDSSASNGVIIYSDLLLDYIKRNYPKFYFVSSTTKVMTDFSEFEKELQRKEFRFVVPDFRLNKSFEQLNALPWELKDKVEFLCNECCWVKCSSRAACYETVSRKNLGEECLEHICTAPEGYLGYQFSRAMNNPAFIGINDIRDKYLSMGFSNFKIEGRGLGSALILEFLLYYLAKPEHHIRIREMIYLDSMLDLF